MIQLTCTVGPALLKLINVGQLVKVFSIHAKEGGDCISHPFNFHWAALGNFQIWISLGSGIWTNLSGVREGAS